MERLVANPLRVVLPRRAAGGVLLEGKRAANARGSSASRGAHGLEAGADPTHVDVPVRCCLVAEVDRRLRPREALLPNASARKGGGGRGERGPGSRMNSSTPVASANGAHRVRSLSLRRPDVAGGAAGDKKPRTELVRVGSNHRAGRPQENPKERSSRENLGKKGAQSPLERAEEEQRIPCRWKAPRAGKSHAVSRRWGGSGLGGPRRIGTRAHREKARTGIERRLRQRCQRFDRRARGYGRTTPPRSPDDPPKRCGAS